MPKKVNYKIPFDENGNLCGYASPLGDYEWKENSHFTDTLYLMATERGRSAAHFIYKSSLTGKKYTMFMTDLADMVSTGIPCNIVHGVWTFVKRGSNFGVKLVCIVEE